MKTFGKRGLSILFLSIFASYVVIPTPTLAASTLTFTVKNITLNGTSWTNSVSANPGDTIQFKITVQNTSNAPADNITVKNIMPVNIIYSGNVMLDGASNSGSIVEGLYIGSLLSGQTKTITYQAQVAPAQNFSFGTTTLTNTISTISSDANSPSTSASTSVIVTRGTVMGATDVPTGLTDSLLFDSFFLPLIFGIAGFWAYRNGYILKNK